jgi:hypothetical protein
MSADKQAILVNENPFSPVIFSSVKKSLQTAPKITVFTKLNASSQEKKW